MSELSPTIRENIQSAYRALADNTENFKPRRAQREMIGAIASHLGVDAYEGADRPDDFNTPILAVEAGTGTGKTFGYTLPLVVLAKALKKTLIITTGTVALQEQVCRKDLPLLCLKSELDFSFVLAKGRKRYICPSRLEELTGGDVRQSSLSLGADSVVDKHHAVLFDLAERFADGSWSGERDDLQHAVADASWDAVSTDRHGCLGAQCSHIGNCPFFKARAEMEGADVIVANHDLLLSDLAMGGGIILPEPEGCLLAVDEAHHLADRALQRIEANHWLQGARDWLGKIDKVLDSARTALVGEFSDKVNTNDAAASAEALRNALLRLGFDLPTESALRIPAQQDEAIWRFEHGVIPPLIAQAGPEMVDRSRELVDVLSKLEKTLRKAVADGAISSSQAERLLPDVGFLLGRVENLHETWRLMMQEDAHGSAPMARWMISKNKGVDGLDFLFAASPIHAGSFLDRAIWQRYSGVALTSATLTALGRFDFFLDKNGLVGAPRLRSMRLPSPFDYERNGILAIPPLKADPKDSEAHTQEVIGWFNADGVSEGEATLALFTSFKQLRAVRDGLAPELRDMALVQGDLAKSEILERHRRAVDAGLGSLILGLDSFGEGVDLPGAYCTHVVIVKLPFSVPSSPVEEAISEWLESNGRNPFLEVSVPATSTKLVQRVGRLIRSETDTGKVSILDNRVLKKNYGRGLLAALPPFTRYVA